MLIHSAVITGSVQLNNTDVSSITNVAGFATTSSVDSLVVKTGSYASTSSLNELQSKTGSYATTSSVNNLQSVTGSYATTSSFGAYTSSNDTTNTTQNTRLSTIESVTGSYATTSSFGAYSSSINTFTSSATTRLNTIESVTGSYATTSSVNNLQSVTGSYATTGSNQFNGNQSISGSITSNGTITAQTLVVQTVTSSIEFVTGSTRNGSLSSNTHQFTGSVSITGSAAALLSVNNNVLYVSSSGNVLIGATTGDNYKLQIVGANQATSTFGQTYAGVAAYSQWISSSGAFVMGLDGAAGTTPRITISSTGNVGIGTSSPSQLLCLSSNQPDIQVAYTSSQYGRLIFKENTTEKGAFQYVGSTFSESTRQNALELYNVAAGPIIMYTGGTERVRVTSSGVKFANGASSLNYYEEGSWTPAIRGTGTFGTAAYQFRSGTYVRIGNYVFIRWGFKLSSFSGASGTMQITGLPFTSLNWGSYQEPNISVSTGGLATADYAQRGRVFVTSGGDVMEGRIANNSDTPWPVSEFNGDEWIIGEIFYNIA